MASRGKGNPTPSELFLAKKKKEILDRSMALILKRLDECLENPNSIPAPRRRVAKRARDDQETAVDNDRTATGATDDAIDSRSKKKLKHDATAGRRFACPFFKHNVAKYKHIKTCCGPGWKDVHRVKEHLYRRHSAKNSCARCFEQFEDEAALKAHQRSEEPCKLEKNNIPDVITEDKEKLLHLRAKAGCSEEDKWQEMYRIIFPNEKIPSPYYDDSDGADSEKDSGSSSRDWEEFKKFAKQEVPKLVKPLLQQYIDQYFQDFDEKMTQKSIEITKVVENQVLRTWLYNEEQQHLFPPGGAAPSPPPSVSARAVSPEPEVKPVSYNNLMDEWKGNHNSAELWTDLMAGPLALDNVFDASHMGLGCGNDSFSTDSAYFTCSDRGGTSGLHQVAGAVVGAALGGGAMYPQYLG
ncbi:hypothetical protein QBC40DRAFT_13385 [Triangularia verruculosa]|uniref:C2H2-type domain-containing protein n=1 Tax=Triangularia verruculosa TaxID=2587418 RepID=A0AAN6XAZ0_9PEZI|nr:hypothetical protein QBC40DRAFT_13385 [Triangularia verruculosa]